MTNERRSALLSTASLFLVSSLTLITPTVSAQDQESSSDDDNVVLEEIIVTARKREESLQDVPAAISAITGQGLEDIGAEGFADYAGTIPGLLFQDLQVGAAGRGQQAVIRGVTSNLGANFSQATVAVYLDDLSLPTFFDPDPVDLERVEVLRGPQGTLYGDRSLSGAIKFVTARPQLNETSLSVDATSSLTRFSDDISFRGSAVANVPLVEDKLALRVVAAYEDQAGFIDSDGSDPFDVVDNEFVGEDINSREELQLRAKLLWQATDNLSILGTVFYEDDALGASPNFDPAKDGLVTTALFAPDPNERETLAANLRIDYDLGWADFISTTSVLDDRSSIILALTAFFQPNVEAVAGLLSGAPVDFRDPFRTTEENRTDAFTHEMRLQSKLDGPLNYLVGFYYFDSEFDSDAAAVQPGFAPFNTPVVTAFGFVGDGTDTVFDFSGQGSLEEIAGFGEIVFDALDDRLQLTAGARLFRTETEARDLDGNVTASASDSDVIFRFSGSYKFDDDTLIYAQVSEGFRSGGGNVAVPDAPPEFVDEFTSDTVWNYELGLKASFFENRVTTNLSAFLVDWSDIQTQITTAGGFLFTANAGAAETYGIELEVFTLPFENFNLSGSLAYLKAELTEDVPGAGLVDGQRLPGTPEITGSVTARYTHRVSETMELVPSVLYTYRGQSFSGFGVNQGFELDAFSRLNVGVSLTDLEDNWSVTLFADNLTDERPVVSPFTFRTVPQVATIRPRTVGISFSKDF